MRSSADPSWSEVCPCHGETTYFQRDPRYNPGGFWRCAVDYREQGNKRYAELSGVRYARRSLMHRFYMARRRKEKRGSLPRKES